MAKAKKTVKKEKKPEKPEKEEKEFRCRYCGLVFESTNSMENHIETECVGKLIHQRTTIIGKLEKFVNKIKLNGEKEVYDIKEGIKVLQKMEKIRKEGKIPVIKIKSVRQAKELKKVIDFRGEIIYAGDDKRDFLNFLIGLKPKLVIGKFSEADEKIFKLNKINFASEKDMKVKVTDTCGEVNPENMGGVFSGKEIKKIQKGSELKLVLDLSLVNEAEGKKRILQTGKLAVPLIEKKLEKLENNIGEEQKKISIEERLENIEKKLDEGMNKPVEKTEEPEKENKAGESKEIKKEKSVAEELNLMDLKTEYLKVEKKEDKKEEKKGLLSSLAKKKEEKERERKKKTLKEAALDNLAKSKGLEDYEKASIIVAHVLKQFLEIKIKCNKELTYLELIKKLKSFHLPVDYLDQIIQFYNDMHIQEYKDEVKVNFQEAYALAERVINDLA
ncbi:MAG: hypothetical protein JSV92_02290 [archaeon]|nr:MAG: hypothetical protein JSV92_02290 [archaeon]